MALIVRVLDLFSGIGGFSLGLERAGMTTVAFCEIDPFCRRVLAKHWPAVPCFEDVRTLRGSDVGPVDVICGGFPCQDISVAGSQAGIEGNRSGLWSEIARLADELRPRYIIVENVAALLSGNNGAWFGAVLGDLAAIRYDVQWHSVPASALGAPHQRDRVWIVAYPREVRCDPRGAEQSLSGLGAHGQIPDANSQGLERQRQIARRIGTELDHACNNSWWTVESGVGRMADGLPQRVDRIGALGNAVVPQIPEIIGKAIMAAQ